MNDAIIDIIERSLRLVRAATEFDSADRAILNFVLHDAIDQVEAMHAKSTSSDCDDVDRLTAELDAARVQLGTLRSTLAELHESVGHRFDIGYHAGINDDPAPVANTTDEWFMRGFKCGQAECDVVGLRQDCEQLRKQLADAETALEARRNQLAECDQKINRLIAECDQKINQLTASNLALIDANAEFATINADRFARIADLESQLAIIRAAQNKAAETPTQIQSTPVVILDASPTELAAVAVTHRGNDTEPTKAAAAITTKAELKQKTVESIQDLAHIIGRTPTIMDWDADCRRYKLPTANTIQDKLSCSWLGLVLDAGLPPAKRGRKAASE